MGTNFYWRLRPEQADSDDDPSWHIGKRSAAGPYCWDCDCTLHRRGLAGVHHDNAFFSACPLCGTPYERTGLSRPAAVELGFAEVRMERPSGVHGASSFSWAQNPERTGVICQAHADEPLIESEYGDVLTGQEFLDMLMANCPMQFTDHIGQAFS